MMELLKFLANLNTQQAIGFMIAFILVLIFLAEIIHFIYKFCVRFIELKYKAPYSILNDEKNEDEDADDAD
jgi:hypothetical protein